MASAKYAKGWNFDDGAGFWYFMVKRISNCSFANHLVRLLRNVQSSVLDSRIFTATRNFALRDRGLRRISSGVGTIGRLVSTWRVGVCWHTQIGVFGGQMQARDRVRNCSLTIRSSREWKEIMHKRPPGFNVEAAQCIPECRFLSSSLI